MKDVNVQEAKQISKQSKYKEIHTKAHAGHQRQRRYQKQSRKKGQIKYKVTTIHGQRS